MPTRQRQKRGHPKSEHGRDPPRSQGLPAPFPRLIPAFPSSLPVSQVWGEPGTRAEPVRGCSVPAAGWTQIKPSGNKGGQDGWTDGRADGRTLQSRARNTVFSTEILTSCIPKEAESASLLGDQLQLPLPSSEPARAPPGPDSWWIFKHQPSEFWGSLGVRIWATIHFQAVLTSSSSAGRLDLLITFPRRPGSWIGDLENICHCNNVTPQPLPRSPSHYSRTFWLLGNISHGKGRLRNVCGAAEGAPVVCHLHIPWTG